MTERPAGPCIMVIFGGSGDLTRRKLLPALYNLRREGLLPDAFAVVGLATRDLSTAAFREALGKELATQVRDLDPVIRDWLLERTEYLQADFHDAKAYERLRETLENTDQARQTGGNYLFYLATPPSLFADIVGHLGATALTREEDGHWRRVVVEKPFGRDLDSARRLNSRLRQNLDEDQIYRIDHYLGKETVQNILVFRFANGIFEPIWNRRYINHVQITVAESLGVEHRGRYYEEAGALRDMVPNHIVQLLSLIAMEPPTSFEADAVRNEKSKILAALQSIPPTEVLTSAVRGQYGPGSTAAGEPLAGYRDEPKVDPASAIETFVALKLKIDNWRWADVPFYLRTGKRLPTRMTEIVIQFKRAPYMLFRNTPVDHLEPNRLVLRIQPAEGIQLSFSAKEPGPVLKMGNVEMDFCYADYFGGTPATGYETLLHDCFRGDATLFQRGDNLEDAWRVVTPILDLWQALPPRDFSNYAAGSWGPAAADELLRTDGRSWHLPKAD